MMMLVSSGLLGVNAGCQSIHAPWTRIATDRPDRPLDAPDVRTARDAVPDSVMLQGQMSGGYGDSPSGP